MYVNAELIKSRITADIQMHTANPDHGGFHLQDLISHLGEMAKHAEEMRQVTGENFNLFQILGVGHYEVSTHSALLANLLDPQGSHGQRERFLECFVKTLNLSDSFNSRSASVRVETSIGPRTVSTGGRLDILITDDRGMQIAIENKIHACEQENWVRRYLNGLRKDAHLIYLTLDCSSPKEIDKGDEKSVLCISYSSTILTWLEACRKQVATVPVVRESLTQYIYLIQHITNQNTSSLMNEGIVNAVLNTPDSFNGYCALRAAEGEIKGAVIRKLVERIKSKIPDGFDKVQMPTGSSERYDGFIFTTPALRQANLKATISFDSSYYRACFYGFEFIDSSENLNKDLNKQKTIASAFETVFGVKCISSGRWPAWIYWEKRRDWNDDVLRLIMFGGDAFDDELNLVINSLLQATEVFAQNMHVAFDDKGASLSRSIHS